MNEMRAMYLLDEVRVCGNDGTAAVRKAQLDGVARLGREWLEQIVVTDPQRECLNRLGVLAADQARCREPSAVGMSMVNILMCANCRRLNAAGGRCLGQTMDYCLLLNKRSALMTSESGLFEGDYCFSLPDGGISGHPRISQEKKMKSRTESPARTRNPAPAKHLRRARNTEASSENYECPREQMIAEAAYYRAERRGFAPGDEMSDWLQAEADVESILHNPQ